MKKIILLLCINLIFSLSESDIPDFNKFYKPTDFVHMDMFDPESRFSFHRYNQSEHFFLFWEKGFGEDPNSASVPQNLRVDIEDLLDKLELFYNTNVDYATFAILGEGKSYLDIYKMEVFLLYQDEWIASGTGYDDVIGVVYINPTAIKPIGSALAHEVGLAFQYQVYCDQVYQKLTEPDAYLSGFRYGNEEKNGGNSFCQQSAQWQAFQDFPDEMFYGWTFHDWPLNNHRHFEHELMRYSSYWLLIYWVEIYGEPLVGNIWRSSRYPEDAIDTYMRLYINYNYTLLKEVLFDYAIRMATYDLDQLRVYSIEFVDQYNTTFYKNGEYYQVAYKNCPGATGFNVVPLNLPDLEGDRNIYVDFVALEPGTELAPDDPGEFIREDGYGGTVRFYNKVNRDNVGWRYGLVVMNNDDSRTYSEVYDEKKKSVKFEVPKTAKKLFFVVQGCPETYIKTVWDDKETTDAQFPYKIKLVNTSIKLNKNN